ncbi:MAG TPA: hypothetical protein VED40_14845 [Azospirillaceae bacterium]|nr:hypothetical protein [Azospirillaceae bacterium]
MSRSTTRRDAAGGIALLLVLLPLGVVVLPTTVLMGAGLIPTLVAALVDRDPEKSAALTVGAMNLCGVMPFAIELWQSGHTLDLALGLLATPYTWLVMYGAAAIGWGFYFAIPPLVAGFVTMRDEDKARRLEQERDALVEEWGPEVAGLPAPIAMSGAETEDEEERLVEPAA